MNARKLSIYSNPNIGLYAFANDKFCLIGPGFNDEQKQEIEEILGVPVHELSIAGTPLVGVFVTGNNDGIIVPKICYDFELKKLDELGINYKIIDSNYSALGNNYAFTDSLCIYSEDVEETAITQIKDFFNIECMKIESEISTIGSIILFHKNRALIGEFITDDVIEQIKNKNIEVVRATLNQGSDYLKSAIFFNSNGFLIGELTSGIEILNLEQELFDNN